MSVPGMQGTSARNPGTTRCAAGSQRQQAARRDGSAGASPVEAFGSLMDLARLQASAFEAEICDACNTINKGSARYCKGCTHKLPAFYAATVHAHGETPGPDVVARPRVAQGRSGPALGAPFAAFSVAINLLLVIAAPFMPMR